MSPTLETPITVSQPFSCFHRTRIPIVILTIIVLTFLAANALALNFTVICMKAEDGAEPMFGATQRALLFSAIAVGTIVGAVPIAPLCHRFGFRLIFTVYATISAVSTFLIPFVAAHLPSLLSLRILQGVAYAATYPAVGAVVAEWAPVARSGTFVALLSTYHQLGPMVSMPSAAAFCESPLGWPFLYYTQGTLTLLMIAIFAAFYRDSAAAHPTVGAAELALLRRDKVQSSARRIPIRQILADPSVLGIVASCIGGCFAFQLFIQYGPFYLNQVLHFNVQSTGLAAATPHLIGLAVKFVAGPLSDRIPKLGDRGRVILFASISQFAMAAFFVALALMPDGARAAAQICYTGTLVASSLNCVGVAKSAQMISGPFAPFLMAMTQFLLSSTVLVLPLIVTLFAPNNQPDEWSHLFLFTAALVIVVTLIFNWYAQASPRRWASDSPAKEKSPDSTDRPQIYECH